MNHHVNNSVYFTYMENARSEVLMAEMVKYHREGLLFVVSEASCRYKRQIKLTDKVICDVNFSPIRPTSCDISYIFRNVDTGKVYAEGNTRMVLFNETSGRPIIIPDWFVKKYLENPTNSPEE